MGQETAKKYEINDFRKRNLLRLKKFMNEVLFDQIPPLQDLFRAIEELNLANTNNTLSSNPFIVEMVAEISRSLEKLNFKEIGLKQLNNHFKNADLKIEYELLSSAYNLDNVEYFMEDPTCGGCGKAASKRCSKCKSEWYCSRECQVKRWKQHKEMCIKLAELNETEKKEEVKTEIPSQNKEEIIRNTETKKLIIEEVKREKSVTNDKEEKIAERKLDELD